MLNKHSTKEEISNAFETQGVDVVFNSCPKTLKSNKAFMRLSVQVDGLSLAHAVPVLRDDDELVLDAIHQSKGWAVFYASLRLKQSETIRKTTQDINPWAYHAFLLHPSEYNGDPVANAHIIPSVQEKALSFLLQRPEALKRAPPYVQDNKRIVMALVRRNGLVLKYASERLQKHFKVVATAVGQNGVALDFAAPELQSNRQLLKLAMQTADFWDRMKYESEITRMALTRYFFGACCYYDEETMRLIDLTVYDALDDLSDEIRGRKSNLNSTLIEVSTAVEQTHQRQQDIDESLRRATTSLEETIRENEQLKETLEVTGKKLVATSAMLLEREAELASVISQLSETQQALACKEAQVEQAASALQDSQTRFDQQLVRFQAAQGAIASLSMDREKALELAQQIQTINQGLKEQSLQDRDALNQATDSIDGLNTSLQAFKKENEQLNTEMTTLRENFKRLTEKVKDIESSRALLLRTCQEYQRSMNLDSQESRASNRNESTHRFFANQM